MSPPRHLARTATALVTLCLPATVHGQQLVTDRALSQSARELKSKQLNGQVDGFTIAPGIIVSTGAAVETGYDSNPDELDGGPDSPYAQTSAYGQVTAIRAHSLTRLRLEGIGLALDDGDFDRAERGLGQVSFDHTQALGHGWSLAVGGLYRYQGLQLIEEQVAGAYGEMLYRDDATIAFLRGRYTRVRYLSDVAAPVGVPDTLLPLFRTSALDADKTEVGAGVLFGASLPLATYMEGAVARLSYLRPGRPDLVDRDAMDSFGKFGLRLTFGPALQADVGWRFNRRELEDPEITDFTSNFVDLSVRWTPWTYFSLTGTVERTIEEPSVTFARLSDSRSFSVGFQYDVDGQIGVQGGVKRRLFDEIGGDAEFRTWEAAGEVTYDATAWTQYYAGAAYEAVHEVNNDSLHERFKVGGGVRMKFGEGMAAAPHVLYGPRRANGINLPGGATAELSVGPAWIDLPSKRITTVVGGPFFDQALGQLTDHDGDMRGVGGKLTLDRLATYDVGPGRSLSFGVTGAYSYYDAQGKSACDFTAITDCAFVNLVDFDPIEENNTGPFGSLRTTVDREVHRWQVAPFAHVGHVTGGDGSLKDHAPVHRVVSPFLVGVDVRGLHERMDLTSIDITVPDPVEITESLDTYYMGAFVGYRRHLALGHGWGLDLDGRAGLYHAHTDFAASYLAYVPVDGTNFVLERGRVTGSDDKPAFIGSVGVALTRDIGGAIIGVNGEIEYISHVPAVRYNNDDRAGGSPFGIVGTQVGTRLGSADAVAASAGVSLTIPLGK